MTALVFAVRWAVIIAFLGLVWAAFWQWVKAVPTPKPPPDATYRIQVGGTGEGAIPDLIECERIAEATRRHEEARRAHPSSQKPDE